MRGAWILSSWVVLVAMYPNTAVAEGAHERQGFVISAGLGASPAQVRCRECVDGDRETFVAIGVRMGTAVRQNLVVAVQFDAWLRNDPGWIQDERSLTRTLGNLSLVALYYPRSNSGFFAKAGGGLSTAQFNDPSRGETADLLGQDVFVTELAGHAFGPGFVVGLGYDWRMGKRKSLTPELTYAWGRPGTLRENGRKVASDWRQNVLSLTLSFTAH